MLGEPFWFSSIRLFGFGVLTLFAIAGFFDWVARPILLRGVRALTMVTETKRVLPAPDGSLEAVEEMTRGGFGTVRTTRVLVRDAADPSSRTCVYENRDNDFEPPMRWAGPELLTLCIPAGQVDLLANPRAYPAAEVALGRVSVRFVYGAAGRNR